MVSDTAGEICMGVLQAATTAAERKPVDLNLDDPARVFVDFMMESLKQDMLHHEIIFRNQVRELHRLYWTQKNLMNEFRLKWLPSHAPSHSSLVAPTWCIDSEERRDAFVVPSQAIETPNTFPQNVGRLEEFKGQSSNLLKNHELDFSLHLPANDFISGNVKGPEFCHPGILRVKTIDFILGGKIAENSMHHSSENCKVAVDLEDSLELECHEETDVVFSVDFRAPIVPCGQVSSSVIRNHIHQMPSAIRLDEENVERLQEQKPAFSYIGLDGFRGATSVNQPRKMQAASPMPFDLNVSPEHDELINICPMKASKTSAGPSSQNRGNSSSPDSKPALNSANYRDDDIRNSVDLAYACQIQAECSEKPVEGSTDSSYQVSVSMNAVSISSMNLSKRGKDEVDFLPDNLQSAPHSDVDIKRQISNITFSNSINLPQTAASRDLIAKPVNQDGSEEDTSSSHEAKVSYAYSRKNMCKSLERSVEDSITTQLSSPQNEVSYTGKCKLEDDDVDAAVSAAAEILTGISSSCSGNPIDTCSLPQHSSDSFERMTLQLPEVQSEDRRSVLELPSASEMVKDGRGHRLWRGRGLRDFQKEILPGLLTLSRHEVRKDLQHIGFKRRRVVSAKARDGWFVPVRSRRSKQSCGRRRR